MDELENEIDLEYLKQRKPEDYLDPTNDVLFKYLFANSEGKNRTIALLNALLGTELKHEIKNIEFLPTETIAEHDEGKVCRLDVYCLLDSGEYVNIEMQRIDEHNIVRRSLDYWSTNYKSQLKSGQDYRLLTPVICLNILDFKFFKRRKNFFHLASIHLEKPDTRLTDDLKLVFIELPKLHLHENMTLQEKWLIFLNPRVSFSEKEKIAMNDAAMTDAVNSCKFFSSDFIRRWKYEQEEIAKRTRISAINYVIDETKKKTEKKTDKKTRIKAAVAFMKNGATLDLVAKSLNFTKQELLALAKKNKITVKE